MHYSVQMPLDFYAQPQFSSRGADGDVELHVLGCRLTYQGQTVTSAEAWFTVALRPQKPEGSLGRKAQDGHLDFHTAAEL